MSRSDSGSPGTAGRLRVAIVGTRGIPASYGGFETFAEELSARLAARNHAVTVYGRRHHVPAGVVEHRGVRVRVAPSLRHKYLETPSNTLFAMLDVVRRRYDVLVVCNAANAFACVVPRLAGIPLVLNVDGLEWQRRKWNWFGRWVYRTSERLAGRVASRLVSDARTIQSYYRNQRGFDSVYIPYGAPVGRVSTREALDRLDLESGRYLLYVSRLEPENNAHRVIEAYLEAGLDMPLVIVGDAPYSRRYIRQLEALAAGGDVRLAGAHFGTAYRELLSHCHSYYQATEVGGTHPALIEAMGAGCRIVAHDTPENREVLADGGRICDFHQPFRLSAAMRELAADPSRFDPVAERARLRVESHYDWDLVTDAYEELLVSVGGHRRLQRDVGVAPQSGEGES